MVVRALAPCLALIIGAYGCGVRAFVCTDDPECGDGGVCEPGGGCSFADEQCPSGRRYGAHAPDDLGGTCVPPIKGDTSGTSDPSIASTENETSSSPETTAVADTSTSGVTTTEGGDPSSSDTVAPESSGDPGSTSTTGDPPMSFFDDFERADADALGNGWIERTSGSFQLLGGQVVLGTTNGLTFEENVCHRPIEESLLDVEATIEITFFSDDYAGFPQLHLRSQAEDDENLVTAYVIYIDTTEPGVPPALDIVRIVDGAFGDLSQTELVPFPGADFRYRLRARSVGTDPVVTEAWLEREIDGAWEVLNETSLVDANELRIVEPGVVAFSGHVQLQHLALDDFGYAEAVP